MAADNERVTAAALFPSAQDADDVETMARGFDGRVPAPRPRRSE